MTLQIFLWMVQRFSAVPLYVSVQVPVLLCAHHPGLLLRALPGHLPPALLLHHGRPQAHLQDYRRLVRSQRRRRGSLRLLHYCHLLEASARLGRQGVYYCLLSTTGGQYKILIKLTIYFAQIQRRGCGSFCLLRNVGSANVPERGLVLRLFPATAARHAVHVHHDGLHPLAPVPPPPYTQQQKVNSKDAE